MIRAWSSPDSNKVTNDDSLGDWRAAQGIWRSWHLFLSSSSIVLKGVLCSFLFSFSKRSKYKPNLKVTFLNNLLNHQFLHSWREMKYWHADVQLYNYVKHGYTGLYIHMQKSIYKNIVMHYYFYYYYIMSELSLEDFQNRFRSCWKSSNSHAFWNLGTNVIPTNVVPDDVMATLKH